MKKKHKQVSAAPAPTAPRSGASSYEPPVDQLLRIGEFSRSAPRADYKALGLASEHIPELIRMAVDEALDQAVSDSSQVWAPVHAWRALGQLQAAEAVEPLLGLFHRIDDEDDDWVVEEMPRAFALIGPPGVELTSKYLLDTKNKLWARINAASCLEHIGLRHRAARGDCITALSRALEEFERNSPSMNGSIVMDLCNLEADEALPLIERAFKADAVDEWVMGDWDDVRARFGLPPERIDEQALKDAAQGLKSQPPRQFLFSRFLQQSPAPKRGEH